MSLRFSVLASGSTGNAFYIESGDEKILVDAGLKRKRKESGRTSRSKIEK